MDELSSLVQNGGAFSKDGLGYTPAESQGWLLSPLFSGLEVRYGKALGATKIARLRLRKIDPEGDDTSDNILKALNGLAVYSMNLLDEHFVEETVPAKWFDNGEHVFQGVYVPEEVREDGTSGQAVAPDLTVDQSGDNYESLSHYLAMPANTKVNATTGRIILPYGHRLARVIAYMLIDPEMGPGVCLTSLDFGHTQVLDYVEKAGEGTENERLIPHWTQPRVVTPHFMGNLPSRNTHGEVVNERFLRFHHRASDTDIYPTNEARWNEAKTAWDREYAKAAGTEKERKAYADEKSGYTKYDYGLVPVYDVIVRPTYSAADKVMYDEAAGVRPGKNKIDFDITLNTGLNYTKTFEFQLDANYQTVVFLKINQRAVDYNEAGAEKWVGQEYPDNYYGVNNRNDNALSHTGSSWQRAYRIDDGSKNWNVTDGHYYDRDEQGSDPNDTDTLAQYVNETKWKELFLEAYKIDNDPQNPGHAKYGRRHGDYFILDSDITIDLAGVQTGAIPDPFMFTGHLDCQGHTITLLNGGQVVYEPGEEPRYVVTTDYTLENLMVKVSDTGDVEVDYQPFVFPDELYILYDGNYERVIGITLQRFMEDTGTTYYVKDGEGYAVFTRPSALYVWYEGKIKFITPSYLFSGLNGIYDAAAGTANVYMQNGVLVPYVDALTHTGWRAEIINARVVGGSLFAPDAPVSGYVYNCHDKDGRVQDHVPALPRY